jgi:acyl-CoA dehydrogenase
MNFEYSEKVQDLIKRVTQFMELHIFPVEQQMDDQVADVNWSTPPLMEALKEKAKAEGLWNLFLPVAYGEYSAGLTNLEYAPLAEIMGQVMWASEVFNCAAPDTGNMEVLAKYGTDAQKKTMVRATIVRKNSFSFCHDRA